MRDLTNTELAKLLDQEIFHQISAVADQMGVECYVVGGYVRDLFLERPSKDIDVVVVGSGIDVAKELKKRIGRRAHLTVFKNFGTAQVKVRGSEGTEERESERTGERESEGTEELEVEFVGARKESYSHDSRKPMWRTGRWKTTRTAEILRSMLWRYV
jgi:tRNA nucleotidyltransferase/poly(A) polymerase